MKIGEPASVGCVVANEPCPAEPENTGLVETDSTGAGVVPAGRLNVLRKGRVWVVIDQSITTITPFSDRPYVRIATSGANTTLGAFSNVSDTSTSQDISKQAIFTSAVVTAADGTKIAELEVDFTAKV